MCPLGCSQVNADLNVTDYEMRTPMVSFPVNEA